MRLYPALAAALSLMFAGCATTSPREVLSAPGRTVIVTAFEPTVRGINVGTTVFQIRSWEASPADFDANEIVAAEVPRVLLQRITVIDGRTAGVAMVTDRDFRSDSAKRAEFINSLAELGRRQNADRLVVLTTGEMADSIAGTNQFLAGIGFYRREVFGMKRVQAYGAFQLRLFDCQTKSFTASDKLLGAHEVYSVEWHESWAEFPPASQRRIIAAWTELLAEQTAQLLTRAGLANVPTPEKSVAEILFLNANRPKSWLPEGNTIPVPKGNPPERARSAVVNGLKARGWTLVSESDQEVVGFYRSGKKEAGLTAKLSPTSIELVANDHEIKADGSRVPVTPYVRWQNNLKKSIYRDLLDAEEALSSADPSSK